MTRITVTFIIEKGVRLVPDSDFMQPYKEWLDRARKWIKKGE